MDLIRQMIPPVKHMYMITMASWRAYGGITSSWVLTSIRDAYQCCIILLVVHFHPSALKEMARGGKTKQGATRYQQHQFF